MSVGNFRSVYSNVNGIAVALEGIGSASRISGGILISLECSSTGFKSLECSNNESRVYPYAGRCPEETKETGKGFPRK